MSVCETYIENGSYKFGLTMNKIVKITVLVLVILAGVILLYKSKVVLYPATTDLQLPGESIYPNIPGSSLKEARPIQDAESVIFLGLILRTSSPHIVSTTGGFESGVASQSTGQVNPPHIGIVAGHWGSDSGAICPDGLTEQEVNLDIARRVRKILRTKGYRVDLLQEFDPRLNGYSADALISIHADSCEYINELATGFKVARSLASNEPKKDDRLVSCLIEKYSGTTNLPFSQNSITPDMTSYHTFREIAPTTPAAIIETGFLYLDRSLLVDQPDQVARGIAKGVICFLESHQTR